MFGGGIPGSEMGCSKPKMELQRLLLTVVTRELDGFHSKKGRRVPARTLILKSMSIGGTKFRRVYAYLI